LIARRRPKACQMTLVRPITDDPDMRDTLDAAMYVF
jgi:nitric oxide reductase NorQ protein